MEEVAENPNKMAKTIIGNRKSIPSSSSSSTTASPSRNPKRIRFPSYLDTPGVSSSARLVCEILAHNESSEEVESALCTCGIVPTRELVEEVLRLSYNSPSAAVDFFRWAGRSFKLSPYEWNLMVDILGKNLMFERMWEAMSSMQDEGVISLSAFASVFDSYVEADRCDEALMSFEVMDMYKLSKDVVAFNSLLSVICSKGNRMCKAMEFFETLKGKVSPDGDSYAILLEGWEKEGNVVEAKKVFGEMVDRFGWSHQHILSYETLLITMIRKGMVREALKFLKVMKGESCLPSLKFFSNALDVIVKQNDSANGVVLWDIMVGGGLLPNLIMYNAVIGLLCNNDDLDNVFRLFDSMVLHGAFPDSLTYNMIFQCLIKNNKVREVDKFFHEMIKNEWPPTHLNCASAITMLLDCDEAEVAIEIWEYMLENDIFPVEKSANALLVGLRNMGRLSDARKFAEDMLNRKIIIFEVTMHKLKKAFYNASRSLRDQHDKLERRRKISQI